MPSRRRASTRRWRKTSVAAAEVAADRQRVDAQEAAVKQAEAALAAAEQRPAPGRDGGDGAGGRPGPRRGPGWPPPSRRPRQVDQSRSQTNVAEFEAARAEAEVNQARLNLSYTKILAPVAGHVTRKNVEPGAYVQVGQPLLALVEPDVWVVANFKETQLTQHAASASR